MDNRVLASIIIKGKKIENRFVCPPMGTNFAEIDGYMNRQIIHHYYDLTESGCGEVIIEATNIEANGMITSRQINAYKEGFTEAVKKIANRAHKNNVCLLVQLSHGGKFGGKGTGERRVLYPSNMNNSAIGKANDFNRIKKGFVEAAVKVKEAGADGVELHMAHGYLLAEFISLAFNTRTDCYGGSLENRMRFPLEVVKEVRKHVGNDFIIQARISATERIENGVSIDESVKVSKMLEKAGIDCIHVSCGVKGSGESSPSAEMTSDNLLNNAKIIKENVNIPVIAVGKINSLELSNKVIEGCIADMVAIGRPLLMDSNYVKKMVNGTNDKQCLYCNKGCLEKAVMGQTIQCVRGD